MTTTVVEKKGSVLVVGAGIAGMQAALDCANSGFKVYLLESEPSIGGNMARLDKTFPTNDCAMCMISPKLVEVGRHLNIEIISYSDLKKVEGEAGNFQITINRRARYVDEELCNGCGECVEACPVSVNDLFNGELSERKAIYRLYPQAIPNVFTIDKDASPPPCRGTCPAGVNAQGYIALIAQGKFLEALDVVRRRMPFAGICGRICHHPCESNCNRAEIDEAVSVRNLKRFVADYEQQRILNGEPIERPPTEEELEQKQDYTERVAVVGGGPAGLTTAYDLAFKGYKVTLFDSNTELGGMMRTGIPAYRLPREVLDHEIDLMLKEGIETRLGQRLGDDYTIDSLRQDGFDAIFVATGAQLAKKIPLKGSETNGVLYGIPFLARTNAGEKPEIGKEVVVIGGGNVAMDVARSARRIVGDEGRVSVYCLESRSEMPAHDWEIREAEEEGVEMFPGWGPMEVRDSDGAVSEVAFTRCTSVFDERGNFHPQFDNTDRMAIPADTVILAVGQESDLNLFGYEVDCDGRVLKADEWTLQTSAQDVFAGGDIVLGPSSLVQSVAQGHRAAESIHRYLREEDLRANREAPERPDVYAEIPTLADRSLKPRVDMRTSEVDVRKSSFSEIDVGYTEEEAVAEAQRCLQCGGCSVCRECVRVCKAHAINHEMLDREVAVDVGAIVLASGYDAFDATRKSEYGFGRYPNVVTSMQFERILSASGPYEGHVKRPSDSKEPKRIAWLQCVGSRDVTIGNDYCSSVCCMYATKEAIIAKEHDPEVEATIFYIDMRAFGKGFEGFLSRAKDEQGVRFVRSQISTLKEDPETRNIIVRYAAGEDGWKIIEEEFDLVVLSVGLVAHQSTKSLAAITGVDSNRFGFAQSQPFELAKSNRDGVFLCGAVNGPKDIPETVMQSSAVAALCGELLGSVRGTEVQVKEYPAERDIMGEEPRIGVFVCHCGINIASTVDVAAVADYLAEMPGVVYTEHTIYTCSQDTQKRMKEIIQEQNLNRVIVASCTPRTHEPLFQETMREAGLNKYMFEMADIREQCSWVHKADPNAATDKAKALIRGSVGKSRLLEPLQFKRVPVTKSALVLGGGLSGMVAALSLAKQGFEAHLVEKEDHLGGNLFHLKTSLEGYDWQAYLRKTIDEVRENPAVHVYLSTELDEINGFVGNFKSTLKGATSDTIEHGVMIIATGASEFEPQGDRAFGYGQSDKVITQRQLEARLAEGDTPRSVVMIQCVGSRDSERPYCSRVCCGEAVKNAIHIKENNPDAEVYILYREIRTYEFKELYYRKARDLGVKFIHFPDDAYPEVSANGKVSVTVMDTVLNEPLTLNPECVVLSAATVPNTANNERLAELAKLSLNEDGFFMEAHVKLRPVDFANEGVFVCGLAHSPKYTEENLAQAQAAAGRAACILAKDNLEVGGVVSKVDPDRCASCLTCIRECVYSAPFINAEGKAEIEAAKCQGCGNCAAACPAKAIQLQTFTDSQEKALFHSILNRADELCTK